MQYLLTVVITLCYIARNYLCYNWKFVHFYFFLSFYPSLSPLLTTADVFTWPKSLCFLLYSTCVWVPSYFSHDWHFVTLWAAVCQASLSLEIPGKNPGVSFHAFHQDIFPTKWSNPHLLCLLHWLVSSLPLVPSWKPIPYISNYMYKYLSFSDLFNLA